MKHSDDTLRALAIIGEAGSQGIRAREFARRMWPDSPGWQRPAKCGPKGSHRGGGMCLAGGGYLGKLAKAGLAVRLYHSKWHYGYVLTLEGKQALEAPNGQRSLPL